MGSSSSHRTSGCAGAFPEDRVKPSEFPLRIRSIRSDRGDRTMSYVWMAIIGLIAGLIARALHPGDDKLGFIMTALLGIAGAFVAGLIGQAVGWYQPGEKAGFIASVIGAVVILVIYSLIRKRA
jgi:uncharacterized membrane protein YeaQ/YmgE (transglycosylase-associated protein family)